MAHQTDRDLAALQTEIKQLRTDFAKVAGTIRDVSRNGLAKAVGDTAASTDKVWSEVKRQGLSVGQAIQERPVAAALAAFATGALLSLLLKRSRH